VPYPVAAARPASRLPFALEIARERLRDTLSLPTDVPDGRVAAVAAILRERDGETELLFIRRAKRRGDPWSGHMAWPGGKREPNDPSLLACAVRETHEEIGLDLEAAAECIGTLRAWHHEGPALTRLRGVFPFVFALRPGAAECAAPLRARADEVQETIWIPLSYFASWKSRTPWKWAAPMLPPIPPAYRYRGHLVWGLTQWMLADLLARLADVPSSL
jgi:8-oxo-dGTP pyrophosphatase MutT (NUDIX family)